MTQGNHIVAIDLGTSHLVGMVGCKNTQGKLSILAEEVESSASCIRRGCVFNVQDTALRIKRLIQKLGNKISSDYRIEKVYIGIGGQSLHTIDHMEMKTINVNAVVTQEDIQILDGQCRSYKPEMLDVLEVSSPTYYVDGKKEDNPVGVPCKRIEARYKLIVGQPAIRSHIKSCFEQIHHIELAGIIVSPLSLADTMLSQDKKELGCACIDFGAGTTSVVIYKGKQLGLLRVIPLGGNLITKDLTNLKLLESDAEQLKIKHGSAIMNKEKDNPILSDTKDGIGLRELNTVVEARTIEIVENVYAQVKQSGLMDQLGAGIVLAGGASALNNLQAYMQEKFKQEVCFSTIQKEWMENEDNRMGNPLYMTAISLLIKGTENCMTYTPPPTIEESIKKDDRKDRGGRKGGKQEENSGTQGGNFFQILIDKITNQD